jgi:hypothetical protein
LVKENVSQNKQGSEEEKEALKKQLEQWKLDKEQ